MSDMTRLTTALEERYRIERQLGAGGMATVYLATDLKHDREVALKVLRPELGAVLGVERFLAEIKITARLDHPHILTLIDSGAEGGFLYYVLPLVRGESLRDKLNREQQLGLEEALAITKQVASALDYAHRHGVVHRDIKPENILLLEGEAMLADFGIALAVKRGRRQSPDRDRPLARHAAVHEPGAGHRRPPARRAERPLLAGRRALRDARRRAAGDRPDRPGDDRQAHDRAAGAPPRRARARCPRPSTPRWRGRSTRPRPTASPAPASSPAPWSSKPVTGTVPTVVAARSPVEAGAWPLDRRRGRRGAGRGRGRRPSGHEGKARRIAAPAFALRDRTQLTSSGAVFASAVSADGKQLAYITHNCGTKRLLLSPSTSRMWAAPRRTASSTAPPPAYGLEWSPDRRNLIFVGTWKGRWGFYLALGPRRRTALPQLRRRHVLGRRRLAAGRPAGHRRRLVVPGEGDLDRRHRARQHPGRRSRDSDSTGLSVSPGGRVDRGAGASRRAAGFWQVFDRSGNVADHVLNSCTCPGRITGDALWLTRSGVGFESIVRIGHRSRRPASWRRAQDTLLSGNFNNFSVTADGSTLVVDDGTQDYSLWALEAGRRAEGQVRRDRSGWSRPPPGSARSSRPTAAACCSLGPCPAAPAAPNGASPCCRSRGGSETPLNIPGSPRGAAWADSVTVSVSSQTATGVRVSLVDVRTGAVDRSIDIPDSLVRSVVPLPDGWAWIPSTADRVVVRRGAKATDIPKPSWFGELNGLSADPAGQRLAMIGWNAGTYDSLGVAVVPAAGGTPALWATSAGRAGRRELSWRRVDPLHAVGHARVCGAVPGPAAPAGSSGSAR